METTIGKSPRKIGLWIATSLVVGNMIGSGVFLLPASLALVYSLWAIVGAGRDIVFWGLLLLLAGVPFYWLQLRRGNRQMALGETK